MNIGVPLKSWWSSLTLSRRLDLAATFLVVDIIIGFTVGLTLPAVNEILAIVVSIIFAVIAVALSMYLIVNDPSTVAYRIHH